MRALEYELTTHEPASGEAPALVARGLRKTYGRVDAVAGIDLRIGQGEIFALVGPNGAGKTTAVELLEGFQPRTSGEVSVLGVDPDHATRAWRDRLGIVLQESAPDPGLTVTESLALYAGYYAHPMDVDAVRALVGREAQAAAIATTLSGGQRRRLDFGLALIGDRQPDAQKRPVRASDPGATAVAQGNPICNRSPPAPAVTARQDDRLRHLQPEPDLAIPSLRRQRTRARSASAPTRAIARCDV